MLGGEAIGELLVYRMVVLWLLISTCLIYPAAQCYLNSSVQSHLTNQDLSNASNCARKEILGQTRTSASLAGFFQRICHGEVVVGGGGVVGDVVVVVVEKRKREQ